MVRKPRILLTRKLHDFALRELRKKYNIEIHSGKIPMPRSAIIKKIKNKEGLICFPYDIIDKEIIDAANLRAISTYSVGYDHIDIEYAKEKKIRVGYTPDVLTDATAELAFSLMSDLMRRVTEGDRIIREGKWNVIYGAYDYVGVDMAKKNFGNFRFGKNWKSYGKTCKSI